MTKEHTSEEIKYRLSDLGVQIGNIAIEYITELEAQIEKMKFCEICEYGGNVCRICYSDKPCNNKDKWKLNHRLSERKEYRK